MAVCCTYEESPRIWRWHGCEPDFGAVAAYPAGFAPMAMGAPNRTAPRSSAGSTKQRSWRQLVVLVVRAICGRSFSCRYSNFGPTVEPR